MRNKAPINLFIISAIFFLTSLIVPNLLTNWRHYILDALESSIWQEDNGLLLLTATQVAAHNALLMIPYLCAFLILAQAINRAGYPWHWSYTLSAVTTIGFHYIVFKQIDYPVSMSIIIVIMVMILLLAWRGQLARTGLWASITIPVMTILTGNALSIAPILAENNWSAGDLSWEVVMAGRFLNSTQPLNATAITLFGILLIITLGTTELIASYQRRLRAAEDLRTVELQYQRSQFHAQELRVLQEMHSLVHDLKTPLMTIQGLTSLMQMAINNHQLRDYTYRIEGAVDNLNKMISEILYDDVREEITINELMKYVRAHVLIDNHQRTISFNLGENLPPIEANLIRLARALINVIENAVTATATVSNGHIQISVDQTPDHQVVFSIQDNGIGIPKDQIHQIWQLGFSTKNNLSGLGLSFVKRVIENHQGTINIESESGVGTRIDITIPGVGKGEQNPDN